MDNRQLNCPEAVLAQYNTQRLPQFKGNPLVEALPLAMTNDEIFEAMTLLPEFEQQQQSWSDDERIQMILTLSNFTIPLPRHISMARSLDSMLRAGYCGRMPRTTEHAARLQKTYDARMHGKQSALEVLASNPQLSTLLMGVSGMGKTTSIKRFFSNIPQVIYHPELHIYQITYLHVEMPSDGASIKGLAHGILQQIDRLIPGANYYALYAKGKSSADTLMRSVARVMNQHFVGFLIADEIQNLTNSRKGKETVMTELVSACNELGVPILFVGTNKAASVFSLDFRKSRRASGHGIEHWDRLQEFNDDNSHGEWRDFLEVLWTFQWVRNPVELNADLAANMYHLSQGVIDIAIKLFASAQVKAIFDKSECITSELLCDVYDSELSLLHPMLDALREGNPNKLAQFPDIAPIGTADLVNSAVRKVRARTSDTYGVKPSDPTYEASIAASLITGGINDEVALDAAAAVVEAGTAMNLREGVQEAWKEVTATRPKKATRGTKSLSGQLVVAAVEYDADDYRNAEVQAKIGKSDVHLELQRLRMALPLEELLDIS
ncbi:MAG: transposase [Curvibacter sp.]|nr:MAG: transposase [Curvibacter sp.]